MVYYGWQRKSGLYRYTKIPQGSDLGDFLFPYYEQGLALRLIAVASLIEPFTDVIGNYTSHDGENKGSRGHRYTPFPLPGLGRQQTKYSIVLPIAPHACRREQHGTTGLHEGRRMWYTMRGRMIGLRHAQARKAPQASTLGGFPILFFAGQRIAPQACCRQLNRQTIYHEAPRGQAEGADRLARLP